VGLRGKKRTHFELFYWRIRSGFCGGELIVVK
jgi:hypothetical protein